MLQKSNYKIWIIPFFGTILWTRHKKSCANSSSVGFLNECTWHPSGFIPLKIVRTVPSLPEASSPWSINKILRFSSAKSIFCNEAIFSISFSFSCFIFFLFKDLLPLGSIFFLHFYKVRKFTLFLHPVSHSYKYWKKHTTRPFNLTVLLIGVVAMPILPSYKFLPFFLAILAIIGYQAKLQNELKITA